jgi:integrase
MWLCIARQRPQTPCPGEPIPRRLSNTWWNAARRKAGIDDLHFHDLRHEFGSQLLEAGGELHEVQATLGHDSHTMSYWLPVDGCRFRRKGFSQWLVM